MGIFGDAFDMIAYGYSGRANELEEVENRHLINMVREQKRVEMEMSVEESKVNNMKLKNYTQSAMVIGGIGLAGLTISLLIFKSF